MNKVGSIINCFFILAAIALLNNCVTANKSKLNQDQQYARINYKAINTGILYLASESKCKSFLWERYSDRKLEPIIRYTKNLNVNNAVMIPASGNQTFLATTETMLDDKKIKLWFKFPVMQSKSYSAYIKKTKVDKKLFNSDFYHYNGYHYSVEVIDEKGQPVSIETVSQAADEDECKVQEDI
ncbi:MAG: hypothetical protein ACMZ63_10075 [Methylotenera sp.]